jgi:hypothetical protein
MADPSVAPRCAVCSWLVHGDDPCGMCGWHPSNPPAGALSGAAAAAFDGPDADLLLARHVLDLHAARRAANGDERRFVHIVGQVRGAAAADNLTTYGPESNESDDIAAAEPSALRELIEVLVDEPEPRFLGFLQFRRDGLFLDVITTDTAGIPRLSSHSRRWSWRALSPSLPADDNQREFALAGGVGTGGGIDPVQVVTEVAEHLPDLTLPSGSAMVLVSPEPGWLLLGRLLGMVRAAVAAVLTTPLSRSPIETALALAHLRYEYDLVCAELSEHGRVIVSGFCLFEAGTRIGTGQPVAGCEIAAHPGARGPLTLAVVARTGPDPADWVPLQVARLPRPIAGPVAVTVRCEGPGLVTFVGPPELVPEPQAWEVLLRCVPRRSTAYDTDVVYLVEYSGGADAHARLAFVQKMLAALAELDWPAEALRVCVVGYGQHDGRRTRQPGTDRPVRSTGFVDVETAGQVVAGWMPEASHEDLGAAVEDALHVVGGLPWAEESRQALITVGCRPPYPPHTERDHAPPCPDRYDWRVLAERIGPHDTALRIAITHAPSWGELNYLDDGADERREQAWALLGRDGRSDLDTAVAAELIALARIDPLEALADLRLPLIVPTARTPPAGAIG